MARTADIALQMPAALNLKRPQRISATVADRVWTELIRRSDEEGRSVSNLVAYLLERALFPESTQTP
jgi:hypothetical protein